jgi:hypothetical protein
MSATATLNGRPQRKQLSDQLDRLDTIIDALAEALPSAVADACKEGARVAIKDAIVEILASPELRSLIAPARPEPIATAPTLVPESPTVARKPNFWARLKAMKTAAKEAMYNAVSRVKNAVVGRINTVRESVVGRINAVRETVAAISMVVSEKIPVRRILLVGLGVGLVVGFACLVIPREVAGVVSGLSAASTTIAVQIGSWLKNAARRFGLVT